MPARLLPRLGSFVVVAAAAAACGGAGADGPTVAVTATDTSCVVAETRLAAGPVTFAVTNDGSQITEVYVYGTDDRVMGEVENIGPGTTRNLGVTLGGGTYEVACKPGQTGDGIRTTIEVAGPAATEPQASRQIEVVATDFAFDGMDDVTVAVGDTIEFDLTNEGQVQHEFEVLGPDGSPIGEVGPTDPGADGEVTLTFTQPGTYTYVCGIDDHEQAGMKGTFEVG